MPATILCVDDEPILLMVRGIVLEKAGYKPVLAHDASEALNLFRTQHIDLVITDHLLPDQSGTDLAAVIKEINPDVPILMISGLEEPEGGLHHIDEYMTKGAPVPKFLELVRQMLS
jgi:CheY-like chemotaxis protein